MLGPLIKVPKDNQQEAKLAKEQEGYTVIDTVDIIKQRDLPNSDPAKNEGDEKGDNYSYQDNPWHPHRHTGRD